MRSSGTRRISPACCHRLPSAPVRRSARSACGCRYQGRDFVLEDANKMLTLGRAEENDVVVQGTLISRLHARIEIARNRCMLVDQSTNGTFVTSEERQGVVRAPGFRRARRAGPDRPRPPAGGERRRRDPLSARGLKDLQSTAPRARANQRSPQGFSPARGASCAARRVAPAAVGRRTRPGRLRYRPISARHAAGSTSSSCWSVAASMLRPLTVQVARFAGGSRSRVSVRERGRHSGR